jgi:signal transduction histidine kinase
MMNYEELLSLAKKYNNKAIDMYYDINNYSYMPLLFMYGYRENLIKLGTDIDANDPKTLVCLSAEDILENEAFGKFIAYKIYAAILTTGISDENLETIKTHFIEKSPILWNVHLDKEELDKITKDDSVFLPFEDKFDCIYSNKANNVGYYLDVPDDSPLLEIKRIFDQDSRNDFESSLLMFWQFSLLEEYTDKKPTEEEIRKHNDDWNYDNISYEVHEKNEWLEIFDEIVDNVLLKRDRQCINMLVELSLLTEHLLDYNGGSLYNPFADAASVAVHAKHYSYNDCYFGDAPDEETWALGKLRMLVHDREGNNFNVFDSFQWREGECERIIANIPYGTKVPDTGEPTENFVIRKGIEDLTDDGKMVVIVPADFLSRENSYNLRKRIIDYNILDAVIALPRDIYKDINQTPVLLLISMNRKTDLVKFINASSLSKEQLYCTGRYLFDQDEYIEDDDKISAITVCYYSPYEDISYNYFDTVKVIGNHFDDWKRKVTNALICYVDYNLDYTHYLDASHVENAKEIGLRDLSQPIEIHANDSGSGIVYDTAFLRNPSLLDVSSTDLLVDEYDESFIKLNENAVVLSLSGDLSPKYFDTRNGSVYINPHSYCALKVNEARIDVHYLINELGKEYVKKHLMQIANRESRSLEDILSLCINIPEADDLTKSLSLQRQAYETEIMSKMNSMQMELVRLKDVQFNEYVKGLRQRKHRIQQIMNELCPAFSSLNRYRENHHGVLNDGDIIAKRTNQDVNDYFGLIENSLQKVENLITKLVDKEKWDVPEKMNLKEFILEYQKRCSSSKFKIKLYDNVDENYTLTVMMHPEDLSTVFENITANAVKWGFTDESRSDYAIKIMLALNEANDHEIVISISNNGTPIHPSMDRKHIFDWGYGSHTGYGTWQVKHIVEHYGGKVVLREHTKLQDDFQTEFLINLPLISE